MTRPGPLRAGLLLAVALLALLAAMALKSALIALPPVAGPGPGGFDAERAATRLARFLGDERPHPTDSADGDAARDRLAAEMRAAGLNPRLSDNFACNGFARGRTVACARVRNLVATIGPATGRHLLLSAHYDSTFAGPGAGDAGVGVATLLETAALLRGQRLSRPVTFLFNEGEEMGLIGARAFLARDPVASRVDTLLNFEARGVEGPAVMFETSRPNAPAIALLADAVDRPFANSLSTDLYRLIPNSTDVSVFEPAGWTILNFAIIGNETRYHSAGDDLAALDRRSLQHMGDQGAALARRIAAGPTPAAAGDRLYTDLLGRQLVVLPMIAGFVLLGLLLLFFVFETARRRAYGRPLLAVLLAVAGATALAYLGWLLVGLLRPGDFWRGYPIVTHIAVYGSALGAGLAALTFAYRRRNADDPDADDMVRARLRRACWLVFLIAGAAIATVAPGGLIYFLLPPLVAAIGMLLGRFHPKAETVLAIAATLLLFLTLGPALALFEELMSNGPHWMLAPLGAAVLLPALIELQPLARRLPAVLVLAAAADLFLLPWAAAALAPAYSEDRQQLFTIDYVWDEGQRRGLWAVNNDGRSPPLAGDWRRGELPHSPRRRWLAAAPPLAVPAAAVELAARTPVDGGERIDLRLRMNGAATLAVIAPEDAALRAAGAPGFVQPFRGPEGRYFLRCVGRSCDGATLSVVRGRTGPIELLVVGTRPGLPAAGAALQRQRPARARPQYSPDSTLTLTRLRL